MTSKLISREAGANHVQNRKEGQQERRWFANLRVLMLTTYEERELIFDSLRAGTSGNILKNALRTELV